MSALGKGVEVTPYHLRVTTYNETFSFDLKSPLDPKVYDSLWKKIPIRKPSRAGEPITQ
ncbi:MAG TPA: hypothetical protein VFS12_00965 [Terriglobia bacterium]|nr:hypothetical protein [Terriglobia bacterium]